MYNSMQVFSISLGLTYVTDLITANQGPITKGLLSLEMHSLEARLKRARCLGYRNAASCAIQRHCITVTISLCVCVCHQLPGLPVICASGCSSALRLNYLTVPSSSRYQLTLGCVPRSIVCSQLLEVPDKVGSLKQLIVNSKDGKGVFSLYSIFCCCQ